MKKHLFLVLFVLFAVVFSSVGNAQLGQTQKTEQKKEQSKKGQPKPAAQAKATAMTGCIDEQEGQYVLVDDQGLNRIADLEADGFPKEAFAKHMGHKVTVRGIGSTGGTRVVFKVRSVETISETCAPKSAQQEKP